MKISLMVIMMRRKLVEAIRGDLEADPEFIEKVRSELQADPEFIGTIQAKIRVDHKLIKSIGAELQDDARIISALQSRIQFTASIQNIRDLTAVLVAFLISMIALILAINKQIEAPLASLGDIPKGIQYAADRSVVLERLLRGASWGAVYAAAGVAIGAFFGLGNGLGSAIGRGITAGAALAVLWAAVIIAGATSVV